MGETIEFVSRENVDKEISEARRNIVGGLVRYIKDAEKDFGTLLFHYVHVEDYAQAMVEGWGELHRLVTRPHELTGPFGQPYSHFDVTEQFLMRMIYEIADIGGVDETGDEDEVSKALEAMQGRIIDGMRRVRIASRGDGVGHEFRHAVLVRAVELATEADIPIVNPVDTEDDEIEED